MRRLRASAHISPFRYTTALSGGKFSSKTRTCVDGVRDTNTPHKPEDNEKVKQANKQIDREKYITNRTIEKRRPNSGRQCPTSRGEAYEQEAMIAKRRTSKAFFSGSAFLFSVRQKKIAAGPRHTVVGSANDQGAFFRGTLGVCAGRAFQITSSRIAISCDPRQVVVEEREVKEKTTPAAQREQDGTR